MFFDIIFVIALFASLFVAVYAIVHSISNIKRNTDRTWGSNARKTGYLITSYIHLIAGILICLCFMVAGLFLVLPYLPTGG